MYCFWRDSAADVHAAGRKHFEREVRRFRAIVTHEQFQSLYGDVGLARERILRDDFWRIVFAKLFGQPSRFLGTASVAQEFVDAKKAGTGKDGFPIYLTGSSAEEFQQLDIQIRARREFRMDAFGRDRQMTIAVPKKSGFAEPSACGNNRGIADGPQLAGIERDKIRWRESGDAVRVGFQIIDEPGLLDAERAGKFPVNDGPGKIRYLHPALFD